MIAGVDEVGRGPLAGPVVTAAVILPEQLVIEGLNDSKKLSAQRRCEIAEIIKNEAISFAFGEASPAEIDHLNILHATMLAMQRAVAKLSPIPSRVLVDGNRCPEFGIAAEAIVGGDGIVAQISAASVIAKVRRDAYMAELDQQYPGYYWKKNSGYPTKQHIQALHDLGVTPHHRRSFAPVAKLL